VSIARNQVWLGLPARCFQSGGTCRIHAARARWWSSRGELRAIWPKSCRRLSVTRWESGEQPVVLLTSAFDTWRVYGILKISCSAHVSNASRRESRYFVVAQVLHPRSMVVKYLKYYPNYPIPTTYGSSSSFVACNSRLRSAIRRHHPPQRHSEGQTINQNKYVKI